MGIHPIPIRHGMTVGELAKLLNKEQQIAAQLQVVPVKGWTRNQWFDTTNLTWVQPSPNMPSLETAAIYPGFGLIEGTNLSEGRGTTRPFEWIGAPWIDSLSLVKTLNDLMLPGVHFRLEFKNGFDRLAGNTWLRENLQGGYSVDSMMAKWEHDRLQFLKNRSNFLIYPKGN